MTGGAWASIIIQIVLGYQVDVMKYEAIIIMMSQREVESNIIDRSFVEWSCSSLKNHPGSADAFKVSSGMSAFMSAVTSPTILVDSSGIDPFLVL